MSDKKPTRRLNINKLVGIINDRAKKQIKQVREAVRIGFISKEKGQKRFEKIAAQAEAMKKFALRARKRELDIDRKKGLEQDAARKQFSGMMKELNRKIDGFELSSEFKKLAGRLKKEGEAKEKERIARQQRETRPIDADQEGPPKGNLTVEQANRILKRNGKPPLGTKGHHTPTTLAQHIQNFKRDIESRRVGAKRIQDRLAKDDLSPKNRKALEETLSEIFKKIRNSKRQIALFEEAQKNEDAGMSPADAMAKARKDTGDGSFSTVPQSGTSNTALDQIQQDSKKDKPVKPTNPDGASGPAFDPLPADKVKPAPNGPNQTVMEQRERGQFEGGNAVGFKTKELVEELKQIRDNPSLPRSDRLAAHRRIQDLLGLSFDGIRGGNGFAVSGPSRAIRAKALLHNVNRLMRQKGMTKAEAIEHIRFTSGSDLNASLLDQLGGMSENAIQRGAVPVGRRFGQKRQRASTEALQRLAATGSSGTITAPAQGGAPAQVPLSTGPGKEQPIAGAQGNLDPGFRFKSPFGQNTIGQPPAF